jgi:hypothetical protein
MITASVAAASELHLFTKIPRWMVDIDQLSLAGWMIMLPQRRKSLFAIAHTGSQPRVSYFFNKRRDIWPAELFLKCRQSMLELSPPIKQAGVVSG